MTFLDAPSKLGIAPTLKRSDLRDPDGFARYQVRQVARPQTHGYLGFSSHAIPVVAVRRHRVSDYGFLVGAKVGFNCWRGCSGKWNHFLIMIATIPSIPSRRCHFSRCLQG